MADRGAPLGSLLHFPFQNKATARNARRDLGQKRSRRKRKKEGGQNFSSAGDYFTREDAADSWEVGAAEAQTMRKRRHDALILAMEGGGLPPCASAAYFRNLSGR
jgi:hypothetical protein